MNRSQFDHAIRAAAAVVGEEEVLVIGSQAIHASLEDDIPESAMRSVEADIALFADEDGAKADLVDGSIGEASMFHHSFGFYAQGVSIESAILPGGWEERLIRYEPPDAGGVVAWCLAPEDLWVSKALAGRPKDLEFCRSLLQTDLVEKDELRRLIASADALDAKETLALSLLDEDSPDS
jgi:hypothetical protein